MTLRQLELDEAEFDRVLAGRKRMPVDVSRDKWVVVEEWTHQLDRRIGGGMTVTGVFDTLIAADAWIDYLERTQSHLKSVSAIQLSEVISHGTA